MAFFAKSLSFFFLLVLISPLQIQARESKFFSKFIHISAKSKAIPESQISHAPRAAPELAPTAAAEPTSYPALAPTPEAETTSIPAIAPTPATEPTITAEPVSAPALAPTLFYADSENGYGLYGHGSDQFPPTKETVTSTTDENDLVNELSAENYETGYQNSNYNYNGYGNNYNGYVTEKQGMSDTRFTQNYQNSMNENTNNNYFNKNAYSNNYNSNDYTKNYNNNGYTKNYNNNGYVTEKQGMSDTRFMQNYQNSNDNNEYTATTTTNNNNVYSHNYNNNGYTSNTGYTGNYDNNGYSSSYNTNAYETEKQGMSDTRFLENGKYYHDTKNENNYYLNGFDSEKAANEAYNGINQNANEFNTMEEYENRQEYHDSPEKYVP